MLSISVVIVSYNSERFLKKNLESLVNQSQNFKQIIVVDNNSSDLSREVAGSFNEVTVISISDNVGYSVAVNRGIEESTSDILLISNPDTYFDLGFSKLVLQKFEADRELALMSPLILRFEQRKIDSAGQGSSISFYPVEKGFGKDVGGILLKEEKTFSVCGAATVFCRKALEKLMVGDEYYDENFFLFWEDFDIGWRANLLGLKIKFFPDVIAYHYRGGTMKKSFITKFSMSLARSPEIKFHLIKNRYLTLIKNFRLKKDWYHLPFILIKDILWVGILTLSSPKIIIRFAELPGYFKKAREKRKIIKKNE